MKKQVLILLTGVLILIASTFLSASNNSPLLKFVPAQTILFSGNTQLLKLNDYPLVSLSQTFSTTLSEAELDAMGKELSFLYMLYEELETTVLQGSTVLQARYGLSQNFALALYTIGASPVLKITLDDEQTFLSVLNEAEKKSGMTYLTGNFGLQTYRIYPMNDKQQLIIAIQAMEGRDKLATVALLNNNSSDSQKELIFGMKLPKQSITEKIIKIQKENQYLSLSVSFLDFKELVSSFFNKRDLIKSEKNPWLELFGAQEQMITSLQDSNCEADIIALTQEMPQLIAGYKKYQLQDQRVIMDFEALLELKNNNVKTELNSFRGFIPSYIRKGAQDNIIAFGLGINFSQISPFFVYVSKILRESTFQCEQLKALQKDVSQINPLMLAMMSGVIDGVQGISFALQDFRMVEKSQILKEKTSDKPSDISKQSDMNRDIFELSTLMSLSAENPLRVWQMMSVFVPQAALIIPSEIPQKLNFPELDAMGLNIFIVTKGEHLVLYSGKKAEELSRTLLREKIVSNGFFQETLNYTHLNKAMKDLRLLVASADSNQNAIPAEACIYFDETINVLSKFSGFIDYQNDFVSNGWLNILSADIELNLTSSYQLPGIYETYYIEDGCYLVKVGLEEVVEDGTGFYQQYSDDGECFIFETRYRWNQVSEEMNLQYVSERSRPEGVCTNEFEKWAIPEPEYINDTCQLRKVDEGDFSCLYQWDGELTKSVYKRI